MGKGKYEYFEEQALLGIYWDYWSGEKECRVGQNGVVSIKISMECGQMAAVPWAVVFYEDGRCVKHNMALIASVELALKA